MGLIPLVSEKESAYCCGGCDAWFLKSGIPSSCLVNHPPGTCCHYGETPCYPPEQKNPPRPFLRMTEGPSP